ncbi:MAG: hypothetical protein ACLRZH_04555 [Ruthenibacterium lactatiformans]
MENCVFGSLAAKTSNGPITLSGVTGGDCEAASNNARITAEHCRFAKSCGCRRATGLSAPRMWRRRPHVQNSQRRHYGNGRGGYAGLRHQ